MKNLRLRNTTLWAMLSLALSALTLSPIAYAGGDHSHHSGMHASNNSSNSMTAPKLKIYKSATCGCCQKWISHLDDNGIQQSSENSEQMSVIKDQYGIGKKYRSCHTAISKDGYVFEGHVPAKFIKKFLKQKPEGAIGLSVPGMPVGSPGMEYNNKFMPYQVLVLNKDGSSEVYAEINNAFQQ